MKTVSLSSLAWTEQRSPTGRFQSFCRNVSLELGGLRNVGLWGGGHPFDVQFRRLPPGAAVCPYHAHLAQWELFAVQAGTGTVRTPGGLHALRAGDVFVQPPGQPHQLTATGDVDLEVMIVADHPQLDAVFYPDSQKWCLRPPGIYFNATACAYFDGEDAPGTAPGAPATLLPVASVALARLHVDDLPFVPWESPKGKFHGTSKELSLALGAKRHTPTGLGGHPFDLELSKLLPGRCGCPFHSHSSQWEMFLVLSGLGAVRTPDGTHPVTAGDIVLHPPGEAHQLTNTGDADLVFYLVADNPAYDVCHYPDSAKWSFPPPGHVFRATEADYWDGEES